jgi:hypothetical protein
VDSLKNAPLVSHENSIFGPNDADDDEFELPEYLLPFLEDKPKFIYAGMADRSQV